MPRSRTTVIHQLSFRTAQAQAAPPEKLHWMPHGLKFTSATPTKMMINLLPNVVLIAWLHPCRKGVFDSYWQLLVLIKHYYNHSLSPQREHGSYQCLTNLPEAMKLWRYDTPMGKWQGPKVVVVICYQHLFTAGLHRLGLREFWQSSKFRECLGSKKNHTLDG